MNKATLILCVAITFLGFTAQRSLGALVGEWDRNFPIIHRITGNVSFPNPNTVVVSNFSYDGLGIAVFLYSYRPGQLVDDVSGTIIPIRGGGSEGRIERRSYTLETLIGDLPDGMTACDIGTLTVWCRPFTQTFSRITIPRTIFIEGGESESCQLVGGDVDLPLSPDVSFDNCESFADDTVQVSWTVDTQNSEVDFEICSCRPTQAGNNEYMAFGLSGESTFTFMVGADVTVAWVDSQTGVANAVDYFLTARDQCRSGEGACPDTEVTRNGVRCTDNVRRDSIMGGINEGNQQCVLFSRPFTTNDGECDMDFTPATDQFIVWANGPLGIEPGSDQSLAFRHFTESSTTSAPIQLGRDPLDRCSSAPIVCSNCPAFEGQQMVIPDNTTLRVHIGPSASTRGYTGITGLPAWGIAWWIDDVLIPELVVTRGSTYTFIVEGGDDPAIDTRYHPFYITSSLSGGRLQNDGDVVDDEIVYAGFDENNNATAVGRYCEFIEPVGASTIRESCGEYGDYLTAVQDEGLMCDNDRPAGQLVWTPDDTTPDVVYYQCASHLNLGWRIIVNGALPSHSFLSLTSVLLIVIATLSWNI